MGLLSRANIRCVGWHTASQLLAMTRRDHPSALLTCICGLVIHCASLERGPSQACDGQSEEPNQAIGESKLTPKGLCHLCQCISLPYPDTLQPFWHQCEPHLEHASIGRPGVSYDGRRGSRIGGIPSVLALATLLHGGFYVKLLLYFWCLKR